jgi:non-ribosomal peptide synthetase component E (peptide arylation enzyme)
LAHETWSAAPVPATALERRAGGEHLPDAGDRRREGEKCAASFTVRLVLWPRHLEEECVRAAHHRGEAAEEAAVIGVPDAKWGEAVKAVVVLKAGASVAAEELVRFCDGRLAGYKRPRSVDFAAALPRNPSGKVPKRELREQGHDRRVG